MIFYVLKVWKKEEQTTIKYSAEKATEERADKLVQEIVSGAEE